MSDRDKTIHDMLVLTALLTICFVCAVAICYLLSRFVLPFFLRRGRSNSSSPVEPFESGAVRFDHEAEGPTTLRGVALENRVHPRLLTAPRSYALPGQLAAVRVDPSRVPEADPPPPTEEEEQYAKESARRVPSSLIYEHAMYLHESVALSNYSGSFHYPFTPDMQGSDGNMPAESMALPPVNNGSRAFSYSNQGNMPI